MCDCVTNWNYLEYNLRMIIDSKSDMMGNFSRDIESTKKEPKVNARERYSQKKYFIYIKYINIYIIYKCRCGYKYMYIDIDKQTEDKLSQMKNSLNKLMNKLNIRKKTNNFELEDKQKVFKLKHREKRRVEKKNRTCEIHQTVSDCSPYV